VNSPGSTARHPLYAPAPDSALAGRVAVWLAGGTAICTGRLIELKTTMVVTASPFAVSCSTVFLKCPCASIQMLNRECR
jgi:hypothetical protein